MVFFLNAVVPKTVVACPTLIAPEAMVLALKAIDEVKPILPPTANYEEAIKRCADVQQPWKVRPAFEKAIAACRSELYKDITDPFHRLTLHQAIMAAGFYDRAAHVHTHAGESSRFMLNHYNFDVRRDSKLTSAVHQSVLESRVTTAESDRILSDLLQLERRLFGNQRLTPVGGRQFLCLGIPCADIHTEDELHRVLALTPIKTFGNFSTRDELSGTGDRWKKTTLSCLDEPDAEAVVVRPLSAAASKVPITDLEFTVTTVLPAPPLSFRERMREKMLNIFVTVFAIWLSFWFVDEEIITLVSVIVAKFIQTRNLRRESEAKGEKKLYLAQAAGNGREISPKY